MQLQVIESCTWQVTSDLQPIEPGKCGKPWKTHQLNFHPPHSARTSNLWAQQPILKTSFSSNEGSSGNFQGLQTNLLTTATNQWAFWQNNKWSFYQTSVFVSIISHVSNLKYLCQPPQRLLTPLRHSFQRYQRMSAHSWSWQILVGGGSQIGRGWNHFESLHFLRWSTKLPEFKKLSVALP